MKVLSTLKFGIFSLSLGLALSLGISHATFAGNVDVISDDIVQEASCNEYAYHEHGFENTTQIDSNTESHARIFTFRIYLHDDFMQSVDFDELWCSSASGAIQDCGDGNIHTYSANGGTEVELIQNDRSADAVHPNYVEWRFGVDTPSDSPIISKVNGTTAGRTIKEQVNFVFRDDITSGSATTTAAVWLKFFEYDTACGRQNGSSASECWTAVEEDDVPGTTDYHWNNETHLITTHYGCGDLSCDRLEWDSPALFQGNGFDVNTLFTTPGPELTATAYDTNGTDITNDVEFRYTASNANNQPASGNFILNALTRGNQFTTQRNVINYANARPGDTLRAEVIGFENVCVQELQFPYCADLSLTPNGTVSTNGFIDLAVDVLANNGQAWPFDLRYESSDSNGRFNGTRSPLRTTEKTLRFQSDALTGSVNVSAVNDPNNMCIDNLQYVQEEGPICEDLNLNPPVEIDELSRDEDEICFSFDVEVSEPRFAGILRADADSGDLTLEVDDIGSDSGNPADVSIEGQLEYTGTLCWEDYELEDTINLEVLNQNLCFDNFELENPDLVCEDLSFDPGRITIEEGDDEDVEIRIESELEDQTLRVTYEGCRRGEIIYEGDEYGEEIEIENIDGNETLEFTFTNLCEDAEIEAEILEDRTCNDELIVREETNEDPGNLNQSIFTFNFEIENDAFTDESIFFTHDEDRSFYTAEYDPEGYEDDVIFRSAMWNGALEGRFGTGDRSNGTVELVRSYEQLVQGKNGQYNYSTIRSMGFGFGPGHYHEQGTENIRNVIFNRAPEEFLPYVAYIKPEEGDSYLLPSCEDEPGRTCYDPAFSPNDSGDPRVVIRNVRQLRSDEKIRVRTVGIVKNGLDCESNQDACLTEQFTDTASAQIYPGGDIVTSNSQLVSLCSYLLTRNAGDVYLEVDLVSGSDVSCIFVDEAEVTSGRYRNSDALVILEQGGGARDLRYNNPYSSSTVSLCDDREFSRNLVGNLSSYVCEVIGSVSDILARDNVERNTDSRVSQATRNLETNQGSKWEFSSWQELQTHLSNQNNPNSGILTFRGNGNAIELKGEIIVPEGAWTLVVENADLIIHEDIRYAQSSNFQNLPSIAFVVNGGNIGIKNTAGFLSGVFYTDQAFTGTGRSPVNEPLVVQGSLYGNIQNLLNAAQYVGSPTVEGGGLTVRYDSRILLNTPPTLSEYVDISTREAVN